MNRKGIKNTRRDFLKKGVTGLAGAAILPTSVKSLNSLRGEKQEKKFIYRTLGKTGIKLPVVSMGSYYSATIVKSAFDMGVRHIDTSSEYNNGNHERMLGEVFRKYKRDYYVIATSFGAARHIDRKTGKYRDGTSTEPLIKSFNGSLERLGLDYVDIYYLAGMPSRDATLFEPYLKTVENFRKEGRTKFIGVVTHQNEPEVLRAAADSGIFDVVLTAYNFRQPHREEVSKAIDYAAGKGLGIVAMKTQAGVYWDKERTKIINQKAALKWALQNENVHTSIPGFTNIEEIEEDISVMEDLQLTPAEKADLEEGGNGEMAGLYCQQCGNCTDLCREDFDIPTLMRSYMYAYGYRNPAKARETLETVSLEKAPCTDCGSCTVTCSMGFDIRQKVLDITRLKEVPREFLI